MKRYKLLLMALLVAFAAQAQTKKPDTQVKTNTTAVSNAKKKDSVKTLTPYEKIFKNKAVKTEKGMVTMHKIDGKVYFEFPNTLLNKPMLMSSVVETVSNPGDSYAGFQARAPLNIYFTALDSTIYIKTGTYNYSYDLNDEGIKRALAKNASDPVIAAFKVIAGSPDGKAVVFEPTSFFVNGHRSTDPFKPVSGLYGRSSSFKSDKSLLNDIEAFSDNITISSLLSYAVTSSFFGFTSEEGRAATIAVKRTLMLLPEKPMQPRLNDPRIGVAFTKFNQLSGLDNGMKEVYYANRWNLYPKGTAVIKQGTLVEPAKQIIFYIDNQFPATWIPFIKKGVERWNDAFEKIGYKNVLVTKLYPNNDPAFDPNNIKYNCIKYVPSNNQDLLASNWVDPRSGEILSASILVSQGIADKITQDLFLHTSAADKRMRTANISVSAMGDALTYMIMQKTGQNLGLLKNYGGSASIPVDSLRSGTYTRQYGITNSVMDDAVYNIVAQPGDVEKGVVMTQTKLGRYDNYAIDWLYRPISGASTPQQEKIVLSRLITEKIVDPTYRYIKISTNGIANPQGLADDLGDDKVKSLRYAYQNLQYVMEHMNSWVAEDDVDYTFRSTNNFAIINIKFYWYFTQLLANIGGMYQHEHFEGDPMKAYAAVPRDIQRNTLLYTLNVLENLSWFNNEEMVQNMDAINGNASDYMRRILFPHMLRWVTFVGYAESKDPAQSYTQEECVKDIFDYVWKDAVDGKVTSPEKLSMQQALVQTLISSSTVNDIPGDSRKGSGSFTDDEITFYSMMASRSQNKKMVGAEKVAAYGTDARILYQPNDISHIWYGWLVENQIILEKLVKNYQGAEKANYEYMLLQINRALKANKV
ncbi:zinc-dependent metalloprotease [Pedobacter insulae]|uniref:DUF5117 domain-containing protein n=1 Tax=Pedobacter insulae TaxID=414048 RepID=A0A1I2XFU6_9SPHI|nr:zinc-dependent metalloprotease [Pedobacter insulae]SFH12404.1 protein of unknown function [Pedobacter insulae]